MEKPPLPPKSMHHESDVSAAMHAFIGELHRLGYVVVNHSYTINPMSSKAHEGKVSIDFIKPWITNDQ